MTGKRFEPADGAVTDRVTGLMWTENGSPAEFPLTWAEAFDFVRQLNDERFGGYGDWRMPNRRELFSVVSHDTINPCLPAPHPFRNVFHGYYWTGTTCARLPDQAWYVHLGGARVFKGMKHGSYMVWPVRSAAPGREKVAATGQQQCHDAGGRRIPCSGTGQDGELRIGRTPDGERFAVEADTVVDTFTGLQWTRHADPAGAPVTWAAAENAVRELNAAAHHGFGDWRMPAIRELESLVDLGAHSPAMGAGHPFDSVRDFYWSATTSAYETRYAWALYTRDGIIGVGFKSRPEFHLWPVRGPGI